MKICVVVLIALMMSLANAQETRVRSLKGHWGTFTIEDFKLVTVDGVELVQLYLSGYEHSDFGGEEDPYLEEISLFYPVSILSNKDYDYLDKNRGVIGANIFIPKLYRRVKLAKRLFEVKTERVLEGLSRGWHRCTIDENPECEDGMIYSSGRKKVTKVEVRFK